MDSRSVPKCTVSTANESGNHAKNRLLKGAGPAESQQSVSGLYIEKVRTANKIEKPAKILSFPETEHSQQSRRGNIHAGF